MRQDDISINKVIEEAGLLSRTAARAKALGGAIKQGASDVATAALGKKPATDSGWRGKYTQGKQEQILKTLSNDIIKDLTKLKLVPTGSPLNPTDLQNTLTQYISKYTGVNGSNQQQPQTSIPTSQATPTPQAASTPQEPTPEASTPTPQAVPKPQVPTPTSQATPTPQDSQETEDVPPTVIPIGSTITDNKGNVYRYTSPDEIGETTSKGNLANTMDGNTTAENGKWYDLSKSGKSAMDTVSDAAQSAISTAWQKQNAKQKKEQEQIETETPTFESFKNYFWK